MNEHRNCFIPAIGNAENGQSRCRPTTNGWLVGGTWFSKPPTLRMNDPRVFREVLPIGNLRLAGPSHVVADRNCITDKLRWGLTTTLDEYHHIVVPHLREIVGVLATGATG